jgi:hypothetical protein
MTENPARGCAWGLVISAFLWIAIFAVLAAIVVWP